MGHQAIAVPAHWTVLAVPADWNVTAIAVPAHWKTPEWDTKQ